MGRKRRQKLQRREQREKRKETETVKQTRQERPATVSSTDLRLETLGILLVSALVFLVYANSIGGDFIFDDSNNIQYNEAIKLTDLSIDSLWSAGFDSPHPRRFLAYMTFGLNHYFHQDRTEGYHIVNILIHVITGILIFYFTRLTLSLPTLRKRYTRSREIAFFVAVIWLLHPMAAQSVAYIVQRMNSLAAMFYMLSLLSYVNGRLSVIPHRRILWFSMCALSGVLSLGSKEIAVTLPFFIILYEWYFLQDLNARWLKGKLLLIGSVAAIMIIAGLALTGGDPTKGFESRLFTLEERVLTQFRVVLFYISLLVFPHPSRLTINHDFSISHGLFEPITTLFSMAGVIGLLFVAIHSARNERLISFCILWFFGHLVIESSILPLELVFEHRTYLPSVGLFLLLVALFYRFTHSKILQLVPLGLLAVILSLWTHERSAIWADKVVFWTDAVQKTPNVARLYNNLGVAHEENGDLDVAFANYTKAFSLNPGFFRAMNNIGLIHLEKKNYDEAIRAFRKSMKINPNDVDAYKGLALTYKAMNDRANYLEYLNQVRTMEGATAK